MTVTETVTEKGEAVAEKVQDVLGAKSQPRMYRTALERGHTLVYSWKGTYG